MATIYYWTVKVMTTAAMLINVAGWREITNSSLPCIGFQQEVHGFTPFTGRRTRSVSASIPLPHVRGHFLDEQLEEQQQQQQQHHQRHHHHHLLHLQQQIHHPLPPFNQQHTTQDFQSVTSRLETFLKRLREQEKSDISAAPPRRLSKASYDNEEDIQKFDNVDNNNNNGNDNIPQLNSLQQANNIFVHSNRTFDLNNLENSQDIASPEVKTRQTMAYFTNNSPPISPSLLPSSSSVSSSSIFSVSPQDAAGMVKMQRKNDDCLSCYLVHVKLRPLFSDDVIPGACLRKLPRLINGIPLGAGFLSRDQLSGIKWRLIEGGHSTLTFISCPMEKEEAEECKNCLKDRLVKQAQTVFGDMIIKVNIILTKCIDYEDDFVINDIAVNLEEGLHFRD